MLYTGKKLSKVLPKLTEATNQEKILININNNLAELVYNLAITVEVLEKQLKNINTELSYIKHRMK